MKILSCNSNISLSKNIAKNLGIDLIKAHIKTFPDHEIFVEINDNVRGEEIFIIQSTSPPVNDNIMELLITVDALKRASSGNITAVIPYFGYARHDRRIQGRTAIAGKLIANLLTAAGIDRILTLDLHSKQIEGFFDIPIDNLQTSAIFAEDIRKHFNLDNTIIVSPDLGGVVRARNVANRLDVGLAIVDKRRQNSGTPEVVSIIGDIYKKDCIIIDDIVDSAGTICNVAEAIMRQGALSVNAYVTHGVLSNNAVYKIRNSKLQNLVITDSICKNEIDDIHNIRQISIAHLISEAIKRIYEKTSISNLFD